MKIRLQLLLGMCLPLKKKLNKIQHRLLPNKFALWNTKCSIIEHHIVSKCLCMFWRAETAIPLLKHFDYAVHIARHIQHKLNTCSKTGVYNIHCNLHTLNVEFSKWNKYRRKPKMGEEIKQKIIKQCLSE